MISPVTLPGRIEEHEGYHPANLKHQPFPHDAVIELAKRAKELGVQFKINGIPFGADFSSKQWHAFWATEANMLGDGHVTDA